MYFFKLTKLIACFMLHGCILIEALQDVIVLLSIIGVRFTNLTFDISIDCCVYYLFNMVYMFLFVALDSLLI